MEGHRNDGKGGIYMGIIENCALFGIHKANKPVTKGISVDTHGKFHTHTQLDGYKMNDLMDCIG